MSDPTRRFTGRAEAYRAARPTYPAEVASLLGVREGVVVADLGAGTGIFTRVLLEAGASVFAVEPNDEMRAVAERDLAEFPAFRSVAARAEATTVPDASVDLVTAAQAFHWFDVAATRREVDRILRPAGRTALVWNDRDHAATPFLVDLEAMVVAHCPGYAQLQGRGDAIDVFDAFFGAGGWTRHSLSNAQRLDREGLVLRVTSTSYAPAAGTAERAAFEAAARALFDRHAEDGHVTILYEVVVVVSRA